MLESKIEQLTAAVLAMTARLDRFNSHFEYVLEQQGKEQTVGEDKQHTPTPQSAPSPTPAPTTAEASESPETLDYTALRSEARKLCIKAVTQKKMNKAGILEMFAQFKEGCDVVDDLPNDALQPIITALKDKGVTL